MTKYILRKGTSLERRRVGYRWSQCDEENFIAERTAVYTDADLHPEQTDMKFWIYFKIDDPFYEEIGVETKLLEIRK